MFKKLYSESELIFDPKGQTLKYSVMICKAVLRYYYVPNMGGFLLLVVAEI